MIKHSPSTAQEGIDLDDVIEGIVKLPLPIRERIALCRKLYAATEKIEDGRAIIEGPFREELHGLFSNRHRAIRAQRQRFQKLRLKGDRRSRELGAKPLDSYEEEELARIVAETHGSFEDLTHKLDGFEKGLRKEVEDDMRGGADAESIKNLRLGLNQPPQNPPKSRSVYEQGMDPKAN